MVLVENVHHIGDILGFAIVADQPQSPINGMLAIVQGATSFIFRNEKPPIGGERNAFDLDLQELAITRYQNIEPRVTDVVRDMQQFTHLLLAGQALGAAQPFSAKKREGNSQCLTKRLRFLAEPIQGIRYANSENRFFGTQAASSLAPLLMDEVILIRGRVTSAQADLGDIERFQDRFERRSG